MVGLLLVESEPPNGPPFIAPSQDWLDSTASRREPVFPQTHVTDATWPGIHLNLEGPCRSVANGRARRVATLAEPRAPWARGQAGGAERVALAACWGSPLPLLCPNQGLRQGAARAPQCEGAARRPCWPISIFAFRSLRSLLSLRVGYAAHPQHTVRAAGSESQGVAASRLDLTDLTPAALRPGWAWRSWSGGVGGVASRLADGPRPGSAGGGAVLNQTQVPLAAAPNGSQTQ